MMTPEQRALLNLRMALESAETRASKIVSVQPKDLRVALDRIQELERLVWEAADRAIES